MSKTNEFEDIMEELVVSKYNPVEKLIVGSIEPPKDYLEYVTKMWNQKGEHWKEYEDDMSNVAKMLIHMYQDQCIGSYEELVVDLLRLCRMAGVPFGLAANPHNSRSAEGRLIDEDLQWAKSVIKTNERPC